MASISLPALAIKPPEQQPNALDQYARIMQIKSAQQQQQMQGVELQNAQQQQQERQAIMKAFQATKGDPDKTYDMAAQSGQVTPQTLLKLKEAGIQQKQAAQNLVKTQGENAVSQANMLAGAHDTIDKAPPEQKPVIYQQQIAGLKQAGIDTSQMPPQYPGDEAFKFIGAAVQGHKEQIEAAFKDAETKKNTAQAGEATAATNKINAEIDPNNPANPEIRKAKYAGILQQIQTGGLGSISPTQLQFAKAFENEQRKTTTQADSLGVTSTNTSAPSGLAAATAAGGKVATPQGVTPPAGAPARPALGAPASGATLAPTAKESTVDMIGNYKMNPTLVSRILAKHPDLIGQVGQKYPDWSQSNYNAANKAITDLAPSGKTGQQITSYNTFLRHAGALYDAVDKLNNSTSSDLLNKPMNWLAQHTGDPRIADFMAAMQPPMKEFQSFLLNNHAMHEQDVKDAHDLIDLNKTPQEIKAVLNRFAETGSARLSELNESFKRVTSRDIPDLVSPKAAAAYNKITAPGGGGGGSISVKAPNGKTYTFKDQASADAFSAKLPK